MALLIHVQRVLENLQLVRRQAVILKASGAHEDRVGLARRVLAEEDVGEGHAGGRDVVEADVVGAHFGDLDGDAVELLLAGRRGHGRKAVVVLALPVAFGGANSARNGAAAEAAGDTGTDGAGFARGDADGCQGDWGGRAGLEEAGEGDGGGAGCCEGLHFGCGDLGVGVCLEFGACEDDEEIWDVQKQILICLW